MIIMILIIAILIIAAILIYASTKPDTFQIQRSISIKAPPEKTFPLINDMHNMQTWSAWEKIDPAMKRTYSGSANGVGAKYAWEGNKEIGQSSMELTKSNQHSKVSFNLDFIAPFEGHNTVDFTLVPSGENTIVTQTMNGASPYVAKVMCLLFFNQDKMIGDKFEEGLASLKVIAEHN